MFHDGPTEYESNRAFSNQRLITNKTKETYITTDVLFHSSNMLNKWWWWNDNTGVWSLIEVASLYTVPLSAINGLSRLTTTSNGQARPMADSKFSNLPITFESNRIGTADSNSSRISKLRRSLFQRSCCTLFIMTLTLMGLCELNVIINQPVHLYLSHEPIEQQKHKQ